MEKKKRLGAFGYSTIYAILIFVFRRVGIPCHAMCCEQIVTFNLRNSSRELHSERQAVALQLDSPIA